MESEQLLRKFIRKTLIETVNQNRQPKPDNQDLIKKEQTPQEEENLQNMLLTDEIADMAFFDYMIDS